MAEILIVGENSFIGNALYKLKDGNTYRKISYLESQHYDFSKFDSVVNCALNPNFKQMNYHESIDVDYEIAKKAYNNNCHYVMISTRKVYGSYNSINIFTEEHSVLPYDFYSENKLISENKILSHFGDKSTVLRGSNLYGFEFGRNSFFGWCLNSLYNNKKIVYNINPYTTRDFIHVNDSARLIAKVCEKRPKGLYNLSSGIGLSVKYIGQLLVNGYGQGELCWNDNDIYGEQFIISNTKLKTTLGIDIGPFDFYSDIRKIGEQLCKI